MIVCIMFIIMKVVDIFDYIVCKIKDLILFVLVWTIYFTPGIYLVSLCWVLGCKKTLPIWTIPYVFFFMLFPALSFIFNWKVVDRYYLHITWVIIIINSALIYLYDGGIIGRR